MTNLIRKALYMPNDALVYELSFMLAQMFPDKYILETDDYDFDIKHLVSRGECTVRLDRLTFGQLEADWHNKAVGASIKPRNAMADIQWGEEHMKLLTVTVDNTARNYIIANSGDVAKRFFARVCSAGYEVTGSILVFANGGWRRDAVLARDIGSASLENLVLTATIKDALIDDFEGFFSAESIYREQGVPWKRGLLLLGPPGNGKTHAIKAMINRIRKPCLYIRSFTPCRGTVHGCIQSVFHRAREMAPCVMVLEDLDSLIDSKNRSFFLNELDGFASNHGLLTVATTNHPQRLDPALLERPSRFDRKITFDLPGLDDRRRYLELINDRRQADLKVSDEDLETVSNATEGFSFAYLKELCLSGMMSWMKESIPGAMGRILLAQVETLRKQMQTERRKPVKKEAEDEDED